MPKIDSQWSKVESLKPQNRLSKVQSLTAEPPKSGQSRFLEAQIIPPSPKILNPRCQIGQKMTSRGLKPSPEHSKSTLRGQNLSPKSPKANLKGPISNCRATNSEQSRLLEDQNYTPKPKIKSNRSKIDTLKS